MRSYDERINELFNVVPSFQKVGNKGYHPGLENLLKIESLFGNPHTKFKTIHVAGTNGKGSVSHILASVLNAKGYKVGLYTSPHLTDFRERIKVDGKMISKEGVISFLDECDPYILSLKPSFFEITTVMAFDYFAKVGVDIAVIECGLGGRLDSTNIITPELSIITSIGMDHMDILGDSIEKIAFEKGGIIKEGVPVVVGEVSNDVKEIFTALAKECNSPIRFAWEESGEVIGMDEGEILAHMDLKGDYQKKNLRTVLVALRVLGVELDDHSVEAIEHAATRTGLRGRWEVLSETPFVVCDIAHNPHGISAVMEQLGVLYAQKKKGGGKLYMVFGVMRDKDLDSIADFLPKDGYYYFTQADSPRAMDGNILKESMEKKGFKGCVVRGVKDALMSCLEVAKGEDVVYVGGSSYVVSEIFL